MRRVKPRRGHGWWPYLTPIFSFLLLGELAGRLGEESGAWLLPLRVAVPAGLLATFYARGAYPELRTPPPGGVLGLALDTLVGVAGAGLWMAPYLWLDHETFPAFLRPDRDGGFDPELFGMGLAPLALSL